MTSNPNSILLTGGAGYIGSHTYVALTQAGFTPVILDDFSNSSPVVLARRAAELAKQEGLAKLAAWKANPAGATLPEAIKLSRDQVQQQPAQVVEAVLRADASALPSFIGVDLGTAGYAVVRINKVLPREPAAQAAAAQERAQYTQGWVGAESLAYYNLLKERFKTQIKVAKPTAKVGDDAKPVATQ